MAPTDLGPPRSAEHAAVDRIVGGFVAALRGAGLDVPVGSAIAFRRALDAVGLDDRTTVFWAGRATLLHRPEDHDLYDAVFAAYWLDTDPAPATIEEIVEQVTLAVDDHGDGAEPDEAEESDGPTITLRYSPHEVLGDKDFADCSLDELAEAHRMMAAMKMATSVRPSRRLVASKRSRGAPDLRRTVRSSLRAQGEPVRRWFHEPARQPRRLVLLLDVSGSMEAYARALLRFVHVAVVGRRRVEAFAMGTRLSRLTRELSSRDPDEAFRAAAAAVDDWSGGTRLGASLRAFNDGWGVRGMARGAVVVILSDGWDRGDPDEMAEQMARLQRVAYRVVWVNPLKASPGYAPLAQGMAAALPYVDEFIEGHSVNSLEELGRVIAA